MLTFHLAIRLRMKSSSPCLFDPKESHQFCKQLRLEILSLICVNLNRHSMPRDKLIHKNFSHCFGSNILDRESFYPFRKTIHHDK
ncbi:hypothetical protein RF55_6284 [Lasius niger]|uniref:Uncharacterized protein n=1 Tax=Lasius niger TaxID=67767 RepID=A0A0J7NMB5_LASNI|nr:hypothetical protein RF55_6284 [Lasius niger]